MFLGAAPALIPEVSEPCPLGVNHVTDEFFLLLDRSEENC